MRLRKVLSVICLLGALGLYWLSTVVLGWVIMALLALASYFLWPPKRAYSGQGHPDYAAFERYVQEISSVEEAEAIEKHMLHCGGCLDRLESIEWELRKKNPF